MPLVSRDTLNSQLNDRVQRALDRADANQDGAVSKAERRRLPRDVRVLADQVADYYLSGGPLPVRAYARAYQNYTDQVLKQADPNNDGWIDDGVLPSNIYRSVTALRAERDVSSSVPTSSLYETYERNQQTGWNDDDLMKFISRAQDSNQLGHYFSKIRAAVANPKLGTEDHSGDRFYEAMAWYTDRTTSSRPDGFLTKTEVQSAIAQAANKYLSLVFNQPNDVNSRLQTWKNIQKLRMLEGQIDKRERRGQGANYPYRPSVMMSIDSNSTFNQTNTIDTPAEFQRRVIQGSYDKPVIVKYGLTYCMHCLLLEQLGSIPAAQEKYGDSADVFKLWWNPNDPSMKAISDLATQQGVTSSPYFIVYDQGQPVRAGYAFPDEKGNGLEKLLDGIVSTPRS